MNSFVTAFCLRRAAVVRSMVLISRPGGAVARIFPHHHHLCVVLLPTFVHPPSRVEIMSFFPMFCGPGGRSEAGAWQDDSSG